MDILFVSTELVPYVRVGGLADVMAALPKTLKFLGHKCTVVLPKFKPFEQSGLLLARRLTPLRFEFGGTEVEATVFDGRLSSNVDLILIECEKDEWSTREGVYGEDGNDYSDNAERFARFSRGVAELVLERARGGVPFDVVHLHDWPTAPVATFVRDLRATEPALQQTKTVLTIHNARYQGIVPRESLRRVGLTERHFTLHEGEFHGRINLLKQGVVSADAVTTVSAAHAKELLLDAQGLEGVLRALSRPLTGITNGVDYALWNPATDPHLRAHYDAEESSGKRQCRGNLLGELGISLEFEGPLVLSLGRLVPEKGIDALVESLPLVLNSSDALFLFAGAGDPAIVRTIEQSAEKAQGRVRFLGATPESLTHRLFAGCDVFVAPSRTEPCGLTQQYAQRYGTLPVVRAVGGFVDTVVDCDAHLETGTGFMFDKDAELSGAVLRALAARSHPRGAALVRRMMRLDRGWERPARQYEALYRALGR